jgi:hypothetical protein
MLMIELCLKVVQPQWLCSNCILELLPSTSYVGTESGGTRTGIQLLNHK